MAETEASSVEGITLNGCAPVPLAAYLKALGVFRLVAEQKDAAARGFWRDEAFVVDTALTRDDLVRFFLDEYQPSPIISPWNGGSGFYYRERKSAEKDPETGKRIKTGVRDEATAATRIVDRFARTGSNDRLKLYKTVVEEARAVLSARGLAAAPAEADKRGLIMHLRARLPDQSLAWFDAAVALAGDDLGFPPLLGSGGNDGNLDFSSNFMLRLADVIDPESGAPQPGSATRLESALFAEAAPTASTGAIGQFAPGAAGGANATAGFERESLINPWDYVLMLEGALMFASSVTRRLEGADTGTLSYPFTVLTTTAAGAGASMMEESVARNEIWVPLWEQPATLSDIVALLSEGRATLGRRPARDGLDFARAVATLGVNRGVAEFQRFGFLQRFGRMYVAAPMSRFRVRRNREADLLNDLDQGAWLQRFRSHARAEAASAGLKAVGRQLDEAIFALAKEREKSSPAVQGVLIALGEAAAYLARSPKARDPKGADLRPPPRLGWRWFESADDRSTEFRIAAALAGLGWLRVARDEEDPNAAAGADEAAEASVGDAADDTPSEEAAPARDERGNTVRPPPFCAHLAPLDEKTWDKRRRAWSETDRLAVWGAGSLERNLVAVADRRLLFAAEHNLADGPFAGRAAADLASVLAFLERHSNDEMIAALAQGLAWAVPPSLAGTRAGRRGRPPLPLAYALLKPLFTPARELDTIEEFPRGTRLPLPPGLTARLRAGRVGEAVELACRRAQASGLPVTFRPGAAQVAGIDGPRLLAALLIPVRRGDLRRVLERAYPALFEKNEPQDRKEEEPDAA
jgi:CRISPR-associated protein Csx17